MWLGKRVRSIGTDVCLWVEAGKVWACLETHLGGPFWRASGGKIADEYEMAARRQGEDLLASILDPCRSLCLEHSSSLRSPRKYVTSFLRISFCMLHISTPFSLHCNYVCLHCFCPLAHEAVSSCVLACSVMVTPDPLCLVVGLTYNWCSEIAVGLMCEWTDAHRAGFEILTPSLNSCVTWTIT